MAQQGGYRKPNNPAPISGPGALSQRTDGGGTQPARYMSGLAYGQGQARMQQQTSAPLAGNPVAASSQVTTGIKLPPITPLTAPTQRPDVPITNNLDQELTLPAMVPQQQIDNSARLIQALYLQDPSNEDVRRMLEYLSAEGRI